MTTLRFTTTLVRLTLAASVVAVVGCSRRGPSSSQTPAAGEPRQATLASTSAVLPSEMTVTSSPPASAGLTATPTAATASDPALEAGDIDQELSALQQTVEAMDPLSDLPTPGP